MDISYCGDKTGFARPGHIYTSYISGYTVTCYGYTVQYTVLGYISDHLLQVIKLLL